jgi:hypothetical protein
MCFILNDHDNISSKKSSVSKKRKSIEEDEIDEEEDKMLEDFLECQICIEIFNSNKKRPMCLHPCGHTLCEECYKSLVSKKCPFCQSFIQNSSVNYCLLSILPNESSKKVYFKFLFSLTT